ncbi:hypothetical protein [Planktotalea sp.]|uniref:hypothetical protein n=1 Tax=Planktotalea sp. TaxID=2029877 RepID=UPI003D6B1D79
MSFLKSLKARIPGTRITRRTLAKGLETSHSLEKAPRRAASDHPDLDKLLVIPVSDEPREEQLRSYYFNQGQFLARQERWEDLAQLVTSEDTQRNASGGGMPVAELLCQGARSDVVALAEHLLIDGNPEESRPLTEAISALESILGEHRDNHIIATIVAMAHLDIAWAWRGTAAPRDTPARNLEAFDLHCTRACQVLDPFCGIELNSPLITSARCALLVGSPDATDRVADDYEDLIDLAPSQQRHIRALGHHMLPQWFGSYGALELEARRTAARTQDIWGAGAYTWAFFDALLVDPACASVLDVPFFLEGLRDILERSEDQHNANLFASFAAVSIPTASKQCSDDLAACAALEQIQQAAHWIMSDHLHELHPLIWGHAMEGFDNQARIASVDALFKQGREKANQVFMRLFGDQMRKGNSLIFTPQGLYVQQA